MGEWQFLDPASRGNLMEAWERESEGMFELAADPDRWEAPTGAGHWEVRDVIGHLVDTTETYFIGFDTARGNGEGRRTWVFATWLSMSTRAHRRSEIRRRASCWHGSRTTAIR